MGCTCSKQIKRKQSKVRHKSDSEHNGTAIPELTDGQKAVIRNNWQVLKLFVANVGVDTFVRMFESRPDLKDTFENFRDKDITELKKSGLLRAHALRVMATVDTCVTLMDEPEALRKHLLHLGNQHKGHMVHKDSIQNLTPAFLLSIKPHIESFWSEDVETAWRTFFDVIIYNMGLSMNVTSQRNHSEFEINGRDQVDSNDVFS